MQRRASYNHSTLRHDQTAPLEPSTPSPSAAATTKKRELEKEKAAMPISPQIEAASRDIDASGYAWKLVPALKPARQRAHGLSYTDDAQPLFVKLAFVGESGVGKTALIHHFSETDELKRFNGAEAVSTIGADYRESWIKSNHPQYNTLTKVTLVDTAGQERFQSIVPQTFAGAQGIALVFDSTSPQSLRRLETFWQPLVRERNPFCAMALVATKYDLYVSSEQTWMNDIDMQALAKRLDCDAGFHVTSCKKHIHVDATIVMLIDISIAKEHQLLCAANEQGGQDGTNGGGRGGGDVVVLVDSSITTRRTTCTC